MALTYGAWVNSGNNGMRVGLDPQGGSAVDANSSTYTFTWHIWTENKYTYNDQQTMGWDGCGGPGSAGYNNTGGSGTSTLRFTRTCTYTYPAGACGPGTATTVGITATASGLYNGGTPNHTVQVPVPARPCPVVNPPAAPTGVTAVRVTDASATVSWASAGNPDSFGVQSRYLSGSVWSAWTAAGTAAGSARSAPAVTSSNRAWEFRVSATNAGGTSAQVVSNRIYTTPANPLTVTATVVGADVDVWWTTDAYDSTELTHEVSRSVGGGAFIPLATGLLFAVRTYKDTNPGGSPMTNVYRVRTVGTALQSGWTVSGAPTGSAISAWVCSAAATWELYTQGGFQVRTATGWAKVLTGWVYTGLGTGWRIYYQWSPIPLAPANFRATNIGALPLSIDFAWDAVPGAVSYNVWWRQDDTGAYTLHQNVAAPTVVATAGLGADTRYGWMVTTVDQWGESPASNTVRLESGHPEDAIAANGGTRTGGAVSSINRWREGQWSWGGSNAPYWGWYSNEAWRYHAFYEVTWSQIQAALLAIEPRLGPYMGQVSSFQSELWIERDGAVGSGVPTTTTFSLADGTSYGNPAEPPQQVNMVDITLNTAASGFYGNVVGADWWGMICRRTSSTNGILIRAYSSSGARQEYAATTYQADWRGNFSWPRIVVTALENTFYW